MLLRLKINKDKILFLIKKLFCIFLIYSGICRLFSFIHRNSVKILLYHGIIGEDLPAGLNGEGLHLRLEYFERQIVYLKKRYSILGLNDFVGYLKEGRTLPRYSVVVTFDDGYKNNYENLKNIILKYRVPLTIFLVTDYIGTAELLWLDKLEIAFFNAKIQSISALQSGGKGKIEWHSDEEKMHKYLGLKNYLKKMPHDKLKEILKDIFLELSAGENSGPKENNGIEYTRLLNHNEISQLSRLGVHFGSHACCHEILTALPVKEVKDTLQRSFSSIKDYCLDNKVPFAYPNGSFNDEIKKAVADAGYNCALTTVHGFNSKGSDLYALKRNEIGNKGDIHIFIATLSGALDFIKSFTGVS